MLLLKRSGFVLDKPGQNTHINIHVHNCVALEDIGFNRRQISGYMNSPVLIKWVGDEFGIKRDVGQAVAVLHSANNS